MKSPYVYMLASKPYGALYIGVTSDLLRRVWQHKELSIEGFTNRYQVHRLVWYEFYGTMLEAIAKEKALKKWNRAWKIRLIEENNPKWTDLYNQLA